MTASDAEGQRLADFLADRAEWKQDETDLLDLLPITRALSRLEQQERYASFDLTSKLAEQTHLDRLSDRSGSSGYEADLSRHGAA